MTDPTNRKRRELSRVVAILDTMSSETMRAADDATLRKFEGLCHHWKQLAEAELALRAQTK
jgi:hypothetical protein